MNEGQSHISNMGRLVEEMENKMRNTLNEIYFGKTRDIVNDLRWVFFSVYFLLCQSIVKILFQVIYLVKHPNLQLFNPEFTYFQYNIFLGFE